MSRKTQCTVDFDQFVRIAGDKMTGTLTVDVPSQSTGLFVRTALTSGASIFYVRNGDDDTKFRVTADGKVQAGNSSSTPFIAAQDNDVTTKKYVDDKIEAYAVQGGNYRIYSLGGVYYIDKK